MKQKRTVIILEGVDKTGKTTLAEKLLKAKTGTILIKQNRKDLKKIKDAFMNMAILLRDLPGDAPIILDRFYPSQMVYSILRGEESMTDVFYHVLENDLVNHPTLKFEIIYCTADDDTIRRRFKKEKEEYVKEDQIKLLKSRYEHFIKRTKLKVTTYNTSW